MKWQGVMPAVTTCFDQNEKVDHAFMANHCRWLIENGCTGVVALGSLGEGATLSFDEKVAILRNCVGVLKGRAPVVAAISALSTAEAGLRVSKPRNPPDAKASWSFRPMFTKAIGAK